MTCFDDEQARVTSLGKEVLLDGRHFADAVSAQAARIIALTLHYSGVGGERIPPQHLAEITEFFA